MEKLIQKVTEIFEANRPIGHDIKHALRVGLLAKHIAVREGFDPHIAQISGLLHDLGRTLQEESAGHGEKGVPLARELLNEYTPFDQNTKEEILDLVAYLKSHRQNRQRGNR